MILPFVLIALVALLWLTGRHSMMRISRILLWAAFYGAVFYSILYLIHTH